MSAVTKHVLKNGMVVLLKEVHNAPLISWWVMYRIGSRNEPTGMTGASHWVEHMLFKGTEKFPPGYLDHEIDRRGGSWNAQTSFDYTAYYETLPAEHIDLALEIEADRMVNAQFDLEEFESERTVIISERQGSENSPLFWLGEEVQAAAFRVHGYHHEIIGDVADLETMTRDQLYNHYRQHYLPNNAIAVAVGDFDSADMLAKIEAHYGAIHGGEFALFARQEPPQNGERRVTVARPGSARFLHYAFRVPAAHEEDFFALEIVNSILCGPSGMGGGGTDNKTSRLYKTLVETELTASIYGDTTPTIDPFLYTITATLREESTLEAVESALGREIERMRAGDITEAEVTRAKKQARALFAYSTERVTSQAFWLAWAELFADYGWFESYLDRLNNVQLEDVKRVAATYLRPENRTVGIFLPTQPGDDEIEDDEASA
ncbi:MAG: insulinase family protein [Anaerolineae bacterium]|nr:insulinase family protein [Anaerolineae bacterium]